MKMSIWRVVLVTCGCLLISLQLSILGVVLSLSLFIYLFYLSFFIIIYLF